MKPWKYTDEYSTRKSTDKDVTAVEYINKLSEEFEVDKLKDLFGFGKDSSSDFEENSESDFYGKFRLPRPNTARMEAAKTMGYRDGLEQFKNPKLYDHRPVSI
jgi:hypothetical protein